MRTRAVLEESEQRFRQLAENIREVFWVSDPRKEEVLYVSPAYEQIWGHTRESLYERADSYLEAVHPEDQGRARAALERMSLGERTDDEYRVVRPDGSTRWIHDRAFPVMDGEGKVSRIVGISEDVTERKRAERELKKSEERYRDLFENANEIICTLDLDGNLTSVNRAGERVTGYAREEILGMNFRQITAPEFVERVRGMLERKLRDDEATTCYETEIVTKAGERLSLEVSTQLVRAADGAPEEEAFAVQARQMARLAASADVREGMTAFTERRSPVWQGR
jgi:PAS domain S-box-containing protein